MATISTTARPAYVYDAVGDQWVPIAWRVLPAGVGSAPALTFTGDSNTGLWSPAADTVAFSTGGVERLRIGSTGNVGIGTSSPAQLLHLSTSGDPSLILQMDNYNATGANGPRLLAKRARGTSASPSATQSGDLLLSVDSRGYGATAFASTARVGMGFYASENHTDSAQGTHVNFSTTAIGGTTTAERMRIDSSGNVGIGTSGPLGPLHIASSATDVYIDRAADAVTPNVFYVRKARGTIAAPTVVNSGDSVGVFAFQGYDGSTYRTAAEIRSAIDATPGASDMPGRLVFSTTPDGSTTLTERMRIDSSGNVGIGTSSPNGLLHLAANGAIGQYLTSNSDAGAPNVILERSRGSASARTVVVSGDFIGNIPFYAFDGTTMRRAAMVSAAVDGTPGSADMPGRLIFYTTADGASDVTERMRIDNAGLITGTGTSLGAWTAYTPTLGAETTAPTLGTGSSVAGYYCQVGKIVHLIVKIIFGTSGTAAGTGFYTVSLPPVTGRTTVSAYASININGRIYDASATTTRLVGSFFNNGGTTIRLQPDNSSVVGAAVPWTWAASDEIWLAGTYEAA